MHTNNNCSRSATASSALFVVSDWARILFPVLSAVKVEVVVVSAVFVVFVVVFVVALAMDRNDVLVLLTGDLASRTFLYFATAAANSSCDANATTVTRNRTR